MITKIKSSDAYRKTVLQPIFSDASDLDNLHDVLIKQEIAKNALKLGLSIDKGGYNIYLSGETSSRKKLYLKELLEQYSLTKEIPNDFCYINNFNKDKKYEPVLLEFKSGDGYKFKNAIDSFAEQTKKDIKDMFNSNSYRKDIEIIEQEYSAKSVDLINKYSEMARKNNFLLYLDNGNIIAVMCDRYGRELSEKKVAKYVSKYNNEYTMIMQHINSLLTDTVVSIHNSTDNAQAMIEAGKFLMPRDPNAIKHA